MKMIGRRAEMIKPHSHSGDVGGERGGGGT